MESEIMIVLESILYVHYIQRRRYRSASYIPGFISLIFVQHPSGRGRISLRSNDIRDQPVIQPNFFSHPDDVKRTLYAIRKAINIASSTEFQKYGARPFRKPIPGEYAIKNQILVSKPIRSFKIRRLRESRTIQRCVLGVCDEDDAVPGIP